MSLVDVDKASSYAHALARDNDITYSTVSKIIKEFMQLGLVEVTLTGRRKYISLTEEGKRVAELIISINKRVGR